MAEYCRSHFNESSLTLPPEWTDIREFTWLGFRAHVRYTYIGWGAPYEKRVRLRDCRPEWLLLEDHGDWERWRVQHADSWAHVLIDWKRYYWYEANQGGSWHTELLDSMIQAARHDGLDFDLVGANSPQRALFKRGFGGRLTPYYAVTTSDTMDLREPAGSAYLRSLSAGADATDDQVVQAMCC